MSETKQFIPFIDKKAFQLSDLTFKRVHDKTAPHQPISLTNCEIIFISQRRVYAIPRFKNFSNQTYFSPSIFKVSRKTTNTTIDYDFKPKFAIYDFTTKKSHDLQYNNT